MSIWQKVDASGIMEGKCLLNTCLRVLTKYHAVSIAHLIESEDHGLSFPILLPF